MKVLSIGDIHGNNAWERLGDISTLMLDGTFEPDFDKYIFIGDYVDSFEYCNVEIKHNLLRIIEFKKRYPEHVILLMGNHDMQYMYGFDRYGCSGYRPEAAFDLKDIFSQNKHLFQLAYQYKNYLWTHAGVHKGWYDYRFTKQEEELSEELQFDDIEDMTLADRLNRAYSFLNKFTCLADVGHLRGGYQKVGGPLWADKDLTSKKPLRGYHQIVGHTRLKGGEIQHYKINNDTSITFIDVLEDKGEKAHIRLIT